MIRHHPGPESILAYANGSLSRTLALPLRAHIEACAQCRRDLALAETLGGTLLDGMPPAELSATAFANVLERLEMPDAGTKAVSRAAVPLHHEGARRWLAPGIWIRPILKEGSYRAYFLGAAPGKALPRHGHNGLEMTQVLEGEFFDGGMRYGPGDFLEAGDAVEHSLLVGTSRPCICLIASDGVPKGLPGLLMRLIA